MKAIGRILKRFRLKKDNFCPKDPTAFFASESAEEIINTLNATTSPAKGITSAEALAFKIAKISHAEYIIIARLTNKQYFTLIATTDCKNILKNKSENFTTQLLPVLLTHNFTESITPKEILNQINIRAANIKSVSALILKDNEDHPIGAIFGFMKSKSASRILYNTFQFFSFNIASELQHILSKEKLKMKNRELLKTEEELKLKNQLLDNLNKNISKAKQIVDESSRLKSAFLANLSHEIRTPMNVIMGFTELLSADNMSNDQRRNYIDIIQQNGTRLLHIMDSLIDISRFQARNIGKEQQAFSLNQMMKQLLYNFNLEIEVTGKPLSLTLQLGLKDGNDIVTLDKEATYKILNHLLDNAVKFTASGFVTFGYEIREKQIIFHVKDSGIGIPKGKEKEIFDLFRQGDLRLSRQFGGTGLGLAIAKGYVNAMNGQIWCSNNEDPKRGAIFSFTLPFQDNTSSQKGLEQQHGNKNFNQLLFSNTTTSH
jgi:signal transduction histidine kinase